ncbi:hypothetical protein E2C01_060029 [Portunus trituberculatus]|uniref:Uncharacterized protein n=1 Tax=Portunus trituberculatus TaxID=210409 RepID=A0A5B7GZX6_PORTR|nr:hypothetical protein [Portunus trituberculatus]
MYKVPRGPSRIIRTRRDLSQKLENLDLNREVTRRTEDAATMSAEFHHLLISIAYPYIASVSLRL